MHFVEVLLKDPTSEDKEGTLYVDIHGLQWNKVEYREPHQCGCSIERSSMDAGLAPHDGSEEAWRVLNAFTDSECERLGVDGRGSTMCRICRESWELDHQVRGPWL